MLNLSLSVVANSVNLLTDAVIRESEVYKADYITVGLDAILFDSMAAPPMFTPDMYQQIILSMHNRLMSMLEQSGQKERELVVGGNTSLIAECMKESGATAILCDYASDAAAFKAEFGDDSTISVRRNINPVLLSGDKKELVEIFTRELDLFSQPIAGTGILPYDFR